MVRIDTRVKICGLTRKADVTAAVEYGAWALGFVVWPDSRRFVPVAQLQELTAGLPDSVKRVAVAVNPTLDEVRRLRAGMGVTTLQLHGDEDVTPFLDLGIELIKAVSLHSDEDVERAAALPSVVTVLVDAHDPVRRGGTGERADWTRAAVLARRRPVILAGGLSADNVQDALSRVSPWAIDVSSGVESAPGIKDLAKLKSFFAMVNGAAGL
jgi:phosphoribosylanthranilate isomerase